MNNRWIHSDDVVREDDYIVQVRVPVIPERLQLSWIGDVIALPIIDGLLPLDLLEVVSLCMVPIFLMIHLLHMLFRHSLMNSFD